MLNLMGNLYQMLEDWPRARGLLPRGGPGRGRCQTLPEPGDVRPPPGQIRRGPQLDGRSGPARSQCGHARPSGGRRPTRRRRELERLVRGIPPTVPREGVVDGRGADLAPFHDPAGRRRGMGEAGGGRANEAGPAESAGRRQGRPASRAVCGGGLAMTHTWLVPNSDLTVEQRGVRPGAHPCRVFFSDPAAGVRRRLAPPGPPPARPRPSPDRLRVFLPGEGLTSFPPPQVSLLGLPQECV